MPTSHPPQYQNQSNGLGIAGFIVSLIGFIGCPVISPIGMIMSIIAMKREPKGFAIAGLVLGILGSLWMLAIVLLIAFVGLGAVLAFIGVGAALPQARALIEMAQLSRQVEQYQQANGSLPTSLGQLPNASTDEITDEWGNLYLVVPDPSGSGFSMSSMGPDGTAGTADDITFDNN